MMSRVRDTNMKIWDFLWLRYNITSPRDTGDSWHLAWELSGAEMSGHRAAGVPLFPNPCAPLSHKTQQPLYCREHIKTEEKKRKISSKAAWLMFLLSCVHVLDIRVGVSVVSLSLFPRHQKLAGLEWNFEWVEADTVSHVTRTWRVSHVTGGHVTRDETLYSATQQ